MNHGLRHSALDGGDTQNVAQCGVVVHECVDQTKLLVPEMVSVQNLRQNQADIEW